MPSGSRAIDLSFASTRGPKMPVAAAGDDPGAFRSFEEAFDGRSGSCVLRCECGRRFYDPDGGWDWEDGELEALRADPTATALEWAAGTIEFEGCRYVTDCDCWHPRARRIIRFLLGHGQQIADFLTAERTRLREAAERAPVVR